MHTLKSHLATEWSASNPQWRVATLLMAGASIVTSIAAAYYVQQIDALFAELDADLDKLRDENRRLRNELSAKYGN